MATGDFYWETTGTPAPPEQPKQWQDFWTPNSNQEFQKYYGNNFDNVQYDGSHDMKFTINDADWWKDTEVEDLKKRLSICEKFIQMLVTMLKGTDFENDRNWKDIEDIANKLNLAPLKFNFSINGDEWQPVQWPDYEPPKKEKEEEKEEEPLLEDELFEIKM